MLSEAIRTKLMIDGCSNGSNPFDGPYANSPIGIDSSAISPTGHCNRS